MLAWGRAASTQLLSLVLSQSPERMELVDPLPEGILIDRYRIITPISRGGYAQVYLGADVEGRSVVIKEYLPAGLSYRSSGDVRVQILPGARSRFLSGLRAFVIEAQALSQFDHPNLVRGEGYVRANGTAYLVMRHEAGVPLHVWAAKRWRFHWQQQLWPIFDGVLSGLRHVHSKGYLHLDIKPGNIFVRDDGTGVLLDFGAARRRDHLRDSTLRPVLTPGYAAPELHLNPQTVGPWSDIYSVGATVYACVTGSAPIRSDVRRASPGEDPLDWRGWRGAVRLKSVIDGCLALDPNRRPASVLALHTNLRRVSTGETT